MKKGKFLAMLAIAVLLTSAGMYAQDSLRQSKVTIGIDAEAAAGGFDEFGNNTVQFNLNSTLFTAPTKNGFNVSAFGMAMLNKDKPLWSFFGISFGYRFNFKVQKNCPYPSYLNIGFGAGIQSIKAPILDTATNRMIEEAPMRGMGYADGVIPIEFRRGKFYPLMFQLGTNISFAKENADFTYNYRAICVLQVTNSPKDINFAVGVHFEKMLTNGITFRCLIDKSRVQVFGAFGRNFVYNSWSGAGGVQVRF